MSKCAKMFVKFLDSKDFHYTTRVDSDGDTVVDFPYEGKTTRCFFSGDDGMYLSLYTIFESIPAEKRNDLILVCNDLNCQYKWITFYVDKDNDLILHSDAILSAESADEEAFELLVRTVKICDDVKPTIMKAIYI